MGGEEGCRQPGPGLEEQLDRPLVQEHAVLDRVDPGPQGGRHPALADGVGGHGQPQGVGAGGAELARLAATRRVALALVGFVPAMEFLWAHSVICGDSGRR